MLLVLPLSHCAILLKYIVWYFRYYIKPTEVSYLQPNSLQNV